MVQDRKQAGVLDTMKRFYVISDTSGITRGEAWARSEVIGWFDTFEEAMDCVNKRKSGWFKKLEGYAILDRSTCSFANGELKPATTVYKEDPPPIKRSLFF